MEHGTHGIRGIHVAPGSGESRSELFGRRYRHTRLSPDSGRFRSRRRGVSRGNTCLWCRKTRARHGAAAFVAQHGDFHYSLGAGIATKPATDTPLGRSRIAADTLAKAAWSIVLSLLSSRSNFWRSVTKWFPIPTVRALNNSYFAARKCAGKRKRHSNRRSWLLGVPTM
jgi:hypothetical protein